MAARTAPRERVLTRGMLPAYAAAWLPIVGAYVIGIVATGVSAIDATVSAVLTVAAAAGLGVPALEGAAALAHRRPADGRGAHVRLLALHGARAAAYASAWVATTVAQMVAFAPAEATQRYLARSAPWEWVSGLFLYGVLAAVGHAVAVGRQLREREAAASRAELHALRAQLDPHFLFNTLHSLVALARRDPAAVERGLETFGAMLRYVLDGNRRGGGEGLAAPRDAVDDDVSLSDELAFVRDYLALERLRLGDRLRVEESLDDEALECVVPPFTVQPLVENAIRHGLAPRAAGGTLRLVAALDAEGALSIEVADDGVGCDPAEPHGARGLGLALVRRRLAARFGSTVRLETVAAPGEGFRVRITIPAELPTVRPAGRQRVGLGARGASAS